MDWTYGITEPRVKVSYDRILGTWQPLIAILLGSLFLCTLGFS